MGDDADLTEFKSFVKRLNAVPDGEKGDLESFLDVSSALKYIASNTVLCNYDSYNGNMHHNFYLYENADGIFSVNPWDFNMSFGGFGGNVSIVQCAADRLANLKAQFGGTADTKIENQKGFGGRGENRGNRNESAMILPEGQNGTPQQGDMQPPNGEPPQGMQPPENGEPPESGGGPGGFPPQGGMNGRPGARPEGGASTDMQPPEPPENSDGQPEGAPPQMPNAETDASGENSQMPKDDGFRGGRDNKKQAQNTAIRVHVNGHIIRFNTDPVLSDTGSTLVGYRSIMEELGAAVSWDEATKTVTAEKDGTTVTLTIGSDTAYVNGEAQTLTQPPEIQNGSTMIPIRFMAEALGMKVGWTESSRLITITSK